MDAKGVIVAICAVVVALTSVAGLMTLTDDWSDMHVPVTNAIGKEAGGWIGSGQYPSPDGGALDEVFQSTVYYTSFDAADNSEQLIVGGHLKYVDWTLACTVGKVSYEFYIWDLREDRDGEKTIDGVSGWFILSTDDVPNGKHVQDIPATQTNNYDAKAFPFKLDGLWEDGATIQVRFRMYCNPVFGWLGGWHTMAVDEARLIRGDGELYWDQERYTVGTDSHARLSWFVPGITSEVERAPVYKLFITHWSTGEMLYEQYITEKSGAVNIPLSEDMIYGEGKDALVARLWNAIFQRDVRDIPVTIKGGIRAEGDDKPFTDADYPLLTSITTDKAEYDEGDLATVYLNATAGRYPISHYSLLCEIEGTEVVPLRKINSPTYSFQVSVAGILHCDATVWDIYGNPSYNKEVKATVMSQTLESWCLDYPDDDACKDTDVGPGMDLLEILIITLLLIALAAIVFLEFWALGQVGIDDWRILLVVIGVTVLVGLILIAMKAQEYALT